MQIAAFRGAALSSENRADFRSDAGVRSVVIQFEDGVVTQLKDKVTNLAGAITAVSNRLVDEVRAEDAARAAALAASRNAFSQSEAAALAAQAQVVTAPAAPPAPPPLPTSVPATATSAPPTNAPAQVVATNPPPTNTSAPPPTTNTSAPASQAQPSATPLPATATSTPGPTEESGSAPARPADVVPAAPVAPVVPAVPAVPAVSGAATSVAQVATAVAATAVPTRVPGLTPTAFPTPDATATPVPILFGINASNGEGGYAQAIFPSSYTFEPGVTRSQTLTLTNSGFEDFSYSMRMAVPTAAPQTALWTDRTNGLQIDITRDGRSMYTGPLANLDKVNALDGLDMGVILRQGAQSVGIAITLPVTAPDAYQGLTQNVNMIFDIVTPPYGNAPH